jgi:hypothetical protein
MGSSGKLKPGAMAPLFAVTSLLHGAALASRFGEVAELLPAGVAGAVLLAHFPLLLIEGFFEGRLDYGKSRKDMPLWMRINSKPVKISFTLAFTYLAVVVLQTWDISIGPVDPSPPAAWPLSQRAMWFGIMSVGMFFPNYLATTALLIPALRAISAPLRALPAPVAFPILVVVGGGLGYGALVLLSSADLGDEIGSIQETIQQRPALAIGVTLALVLVPILVGALRGKSD